ncbi:MAG TPA: DUF6600 domain-containing protein [Phycisphaerae bacterium]|nr:DUF6600 domain-containing protein [Phycisphaerae bacterium]
MARLRYFLCSTLLTLSILLVAKPASAQPYGHGPGPAGDVDISIFYEELAPYGEWIDLRPYGWVWSPYGVDYDWRPYQEGHWVWTEYGWTWVSDEPFGWATYHYGRWHYDNYYGWVWVPGTIWGPSWTAWREGDGWVGWAPLPPDDSIHAGFRIGNFNFRFDAIKRFHWNFVEQRRFLEPRLRPYIARSVRNVNIVNQTNNVTNYNIVNNNIVNNSINIKNIEQRAGRPVPKYTLRDVTQPRQTNIKGNAVEVFRPRIKQGEPRRKPDSIFQRSQQPQPKSSAASDVTRRTLEERSALQRRLVDERAALEERQKREAARAPKLGWSTDELRKRQGREQSAFQEQQQRMQKLLERYQDRDQKGNNGLTKSQGRKFRFAPPQQPQAAKKQEAPRKPEPPKKK